MKLLPIEELGANIKNASLRFRFPAPGINSNNGEFFLKLINEEGQFIKFMQPDILPMKYVEEITLYNRFKEEYKFRDIWEITLPLGSPHLAKGGKYLYRYYFKSKAGKSIDWIIDPFAKAHGKGRMSLVDLGNNSSPVTQINTWKTPEIQDLIVYELHVNEFAGGLRGVRERLPYLKDLGINCIELMPVSNIKEDTRWGYLPVGHWGVDERFGSNVDLKVLVAEAHKLGIAVILDVVYGHTNTSFGYYHLYKNLFGNDNTPLTKGENTYGAKIDYSKPFVRDYFFTLNDYLLRTFNIDGFRYDYVAGFYDGPTGQGYSNLVYNTYNLVKLQGDNFPWLHNNNKINLVQCAEFLTDSAPPTEILEKTYSNSCFQNITWSKAEKFATGTGGLSYDHIEALALSGFGAYGYKENFTHNNNDEVYKMPFQYIENHDHKRFVCNWGNKYLYTGFYGEGDRENNGYKVQPYLIGLLCSKGIPMLWQGQEIGECYYIPEEILHIGRVVVPRPVRWEFFYDNVGKSIIRLTRKLTQIRMENSEFRLGDYYFYNHNYYLSKNILVFRRTFGDALSIVMLNFADNDWPEISFTMPQSGYCKEKIEEIDHGWVNQDSSYKFKINSNYGLILQIKISQPL